METPLDILTSKFYTRVSFETLENLISQGVDVNIADENGDTPLIKASRLWDGEERKKMVLALIRAGADVKASNKQGVTALQIIEMFDKEEEIVALIKAGADINSQDDTGFTPLHSAASFGLYAKMLVRLGANVNIFNENNKSPLYCAVWNYLENPMYQDIEETLEALVGIGSGCTFETFNARCKQDGKTAYDLVKDGVNMMAPVKELLDGYRKLYCC